MSKPWHSHTKSIGFRDRFIGSRISLLGSTLSTGSKCNPWPLHLWSQASADTLKAQSPWIWSLSQTIKGGSHKSFHIKINSFYLKLVRSEGFFEIHWINLDWFGFRWVGLSKLGIILNLSEPLIEFHHCEGEIQFRYGAYGVIFTQYCICIFLEKHDCHVFS